MSLAAGQTLSFYEILGPLGAGGMGEVYLARDTRLEREVAIKVLPEHFADDEERLRRFEREAKTLASLNHPNVAGIHGIDQVGDTCFLAMELVPGEDLAARLARGRLPVDEALELCRQVAAGLEAAHEAGVVHRDLKPANVRVTPDGVVKLLDFGLAKSAAPGAGPDSSSARPDSFLLTEEGLVLGTPTYMSPEQARGRPVDRRTDVWAFGCVLYECLTGRRAFGGDSLTDTLAAIVEREPDWSTLPAATPAHVRRLVARCLDKDARTRLRDVGEARIALSEGTADTEPVAAPRAGARPFAALLVGAAAASLVWGGAWLLRGGDDAPTARPDRRALSVGIERPPSFRLPELSPDGTRLAFAGTEGLMVRELAEPEAGCVLSSDAPIQLACWSPDGAAIAFFRGDALETFRLGSARPERRCSVPSGERTADWGDDGTILVEVSGSVEADGVFRLAPGAAELELLDWIDTDQLTPDRCWPDLLPGSRAFLVTVVTDGAAWIQVASLETRTLERLVRGSTRSRFVAPGWLAWCDLDRLLVQRFDPAAHALSGEPRELTRGVDGFLSRGDAYFSFSDEGTLFYRTLEGDRRLEWVARGGRRLGEAAEPAGYGAIALDPDARRLALAIDNGETGARDLWVRDLARGVSTRLTSHERWVSTPRWSPDGSRIAFRADWKGPPHVYLIDVDGGAPQEIVPYDGSAHALYDWTPDGGAVLYGQRTSEGFETWIVELADLSRRPLSETPFRSTSIRVSPDGRWITYESDETGAREVYVTSFPELRSRTRVSTQGGRNPCWSSDGAEVFYRSDEGIFAAGFAPEGPEVGAPELVAPYPGEDLLDFEVAPDGQRFLVGSADRDAREPPDRLITDWPRLLER